MSNPSPQRSPAPPATPSTLDASVVKLLCEYHKRDLITIPIIKKYVHQSITQRCGLKAATLELDTAAHPNIEYVAGTRLSVYPANSSSNVQFLLDFLLNDLQTIFTTPIGNNHMNETPQIDPNYNSPFWVKFLQQQMSSKQPIVETLRLALTYFVDLTNFPTRELLGYICDCCSSRAHRIRLESIISSEETWERYICQEQRTFRSILEEFNSCRRKLSAKKLIIQELLPVLQPRQYSISNIKSSRRFRAEVVIIQHKFSARQMALNYKTIKEHSWDLAQQAVPPQPPTIPAAIPTPAAAAAAARTQPASPAGGVRRLLPAAKQLQQAQAALQRQLQQENQDQARLSSSIRSLRSMAMFSASPITSQQVRRLPVFSGPLMSLYAASSIGQTSQMSNVQENQQTTPTNTNRSSKSVKSVSPLNARTKSNSTFSSLGSRASTMAQRASLLSLPQLVGSVQNELQDGIDSSTTSPTQQVGPIAQGATNTTATPKVKSQVRRYDGFCSNYLLNLQAGDQILCEFVENPRFTLKGNRERPIMLVAQDVGVLAFRAFWQQRQLEHDRAQVFYTMFKDLEPKKFGEMHLVTLTGHKSKVEELFRREINIALTSKILTSATYINRQQLVSLLDMTATKGKLETQSNIAPATAISLPHLQISSKELLDLGQRIYKLLIENNGCLYTCCDPHMTQALEILVVECITRFNKCHWTHDQVMNLLPNWKGRKEHSEDTAAPVFQLENTFERAQIVQEIYDSSI